MLLPLHQINVVNINRLFIIEERDDKGQADGSFGSRNGHNEKDEYLSIQIAEMPGEGHKSKVNGIKHQLDAHKHHNYILAGQDADCAYREE
jgi:hypothetical protein